MLKDRLVVLYKELEAESPNGMATVALSQTIDAVRRGYYPGGELDILLGLVGTLARLLNNVHNLLVSALRHQPINPFTLHCNYESLPDALKERIISLAP